ncbi:MATE family efflux transporter [Anoxybacter fermentans]|uniref:Multidrug export protein MepA n=1 Tax=Anoxybacter fermentans TaxID=1323375 RepID=A0A3Q9HPN8_9FIRM|nr:MATE family efflux transporter [Anoxybacter fermentans]AZR72725.1 MATE family efflux transporter [Anoxybacter fermentans]
MNKRKYELGHEKISKLLFKYSTPAMIGMIVNALYNMVDTIFIGRGAGTLAIAGLAISFPIQMLIMAVAQTVGIGSASLISRSLGAGDHRKAERVAGTSFSTVGILGILMTIFGLIFLTPLLRLFGATDTILPYSIDYLSVILLGSFFFVFAVSSNNLVRSEGNAKTAMFSMIIGTGLNIILDPVFIFGFNMGIKGAAIATVISQISSFIYLVIYFLSGKSILKIRRKDLIPDLNLLPEIFSIGISSFVRTVAGSIFAIVINNSIAYYGSDLHIAVLGVANRVLAFMLMPLFGIIQGLQPIIGFNYGAKNMMRVKEGLKLAIGAATALSTFGFLILIIFTEPIVRIFNNDPNLIQEGVPIIRILILLLPVIGFQVVGASLFQAIGKAKPALFLSMSRQILFLIPLILILPQFFKLAGIWYAFPLADLLSTVVTLLWVAKEVQIMNQQIKTA